MIKGGSTPASEDAPIGTLTLEGLQAELGQVKADLAMAVWEKQAAQGDAEQIASEKRALTDQLALAKADLERERGVLKGEVEKEAERRAQVEKDLASVRQELERTLAELDSHKSGKEKLDKLAVGYEKAEADLQVKEQEISSLKTQLEEAAETQAQTQAQSDALDLDVSRLTRELEEAKAKASRLDAELQKSLEEAESLRAKLASVPPPSAPVAAPVSPASPAAAPGKERVVPSVPVIFLSADGKSIAKQAFFAVGKGEALEALISALLGQWTAMKLPVVSTATPEGMSLRIQGDPHRRSIRVLPTGAYQIQLSPPELDQVRNLPALVTRKPAGAVPSAKTAAPPA